MTALVTGASSGIGEAFVRALDGPVVAVARREERLRSLPGDVEVLVADLTTEAGVASVEARLARGDIDLLINNAGFGTTAPLAEIDPQRVQDEIALDVTALVRLTRAALPGMLERGRGGILNVSSVVGFFPTPKMAVYAGSKAFVTSFTESVAGEVRGTGVRVAVLCPGLTRTEFQAVAADPSAVKGMPGFLWQSADEVARAGLDGLAAGKLVIVPGWHNRAVAAVLGVIPRSLVRGAAALGQRLRGA